MTPADILLWSLVLGSTSAGFTTAVRALPPVQRWMFARKKPWACDICMSFWTVGLFGLLLTLGVEVSLAVCGPAYPWALWVLGKTGEPHGPPPLPPLDDSAENFVG